MKTLHFALALLLCMAVPSICFADAPTQPMTGSAYKIQGSFASALGNAGSNKMTGAGLASPEGIFDGFGDKEYYTPRQDVLVRVSGLDSSHVSLAKKLPGFEPAISPSDIPYKLYEKPRMVAPNVIYADYDGKGNAVRYILTGWTGTGGIIDGNASDVMITTAIPGTALSVASTITWNYKKQIRVTVTTSGETTPLKVYDLYGNTIAGSKTITKIIPSSLAAGMAVTGYGIPAVTKVVSINAVDGTVTLDTAATQTFSSSAGQRLTFVPASADLTADPRECPDSNAAACAANASAAKSGVNFYDVSTSSNISLTVRQTFDESVTRTLTQAIVTGGGSGNTELLYGARKTLASYALDKPMTVEWRYDNTKVAVVGEPIEPPASTDITKIPVITILNPPPGVTVENSFVWAWDSSIQDKQGLKYFPIRQVDSFTITWPLSGGTTSVDTIKTIWPYYKQKHIAEAPVNLQPPGAINSYSSISYSGNSATDLNGVFNAKAAGTSILRFSTPPIYPNVKQGAKFIVVETEEKKPNDKLEVSDAYIGTKITDAIHNDPENDVVPSRNKTGYLFYDGGVYDGTGPDMAYDRTTRTGAIIPVNESLTGDAKPLVVVWYEKGKGGIGWPTTVKLYTPKWPVNPPSIDIGTGISVSPTAKPKARVYNQPDKSLSGFNPNEEHALITGDTLYALRDDLNSIDEASQPYVLVKYYGGTEWKMDVYKVHRPASFTYQNEAGKAIVAPLPASFQVPPQSDIKKVAGAEVGGEWHLRDHKGGHWAKAANWRKVYPAGWQQGDAEPAVPADPSRFVMQWYYYMQPGFYWPVKTGYTLKKEGDVIPFLNDGTAYDDNSKPIDVTYITYWPETAPTLPVGDTLTTARGELPEISNFRIAEVIFDENVYKGNGPLAKLYAPERYLYYTFRDATFVLPGFIKTEIGTGGVLTFPELPFALQARLFYDKLNNRLGFKGVRISAEGEEPWLLPNLMTFDEETTLLNFKSDSTWDAAVATKWKAAINALYDVARNPNNLVYPGGNVTNPFKEGTSYDPAAWEKKWGIPLGLQPKKDKDGNIVTPVIPVASRSVLGEKNALSAGMAQGEGYVVVAENDDAALGSAPVALHVIRIVNSPVFQGVIKAIKSKNVFDEKLTLHYTGDFGGEPEKFNFEWYYQPVAGSKPNIPLAGVADSSWIKFIVPANISGTGQTDITIEGASPLTLSDNWFVARYYFKNAWPAPISMASDPAPVAPATSILAHDDKNNWSLWSGANTTDDPMLAVGWIKRVVDGLNPLEARVTDFRSSATNTTVSMISQFGGRFDGAIALNSDADNLNNMGLISAYETVLNRGRDFSIDAAPAQNYGPTNDALLNISSRLATFYQALGNEAYADAVDPTIGFGTKSAEYGNMAPSIFAFQNQVDSLLDEELALMRGIDDSANSTRNSPNYNRLIWNFTQGEGEVAYALNYNITDQDKSGTINAADAKIMYPQGHGDAWGHYLQSINYYYKLLGHSSFSWEPRVEFVLVAGKPIMVDYLDERKFATIAATKAKVGAEIVDATYKKFYTDDPAGQWQGYKDSFPDRAWGVDEWARRAGQGAYFDWLTANAILPETAANHDRIKYEYVTDPVSNKQLLKETIIPAADIQQIDRSKVPELASIATQFHKIQSRMVEVDSGVNPLGLVKGVVPFDIDPVQVSAGKTHFEQVYERAAKALGNAVVVYDYANGITQRLRKNQDTLEDFKKNLTDQERDYKNRLIEIFGYPYADDIGSGKTYPDGYDGPDLFHYNYVDRTELTGSTPGGYKQFTTTLTNPASLDSLAGFGAFTAEPRTVQYNISDNGNWLMKPPEWTLARKAPGKIQQTLSDLIVAEGAFDKATQLFDSMVGDIETAKDQLEKRHGVLASQIDLRDETNKSVIALDTAITALHITGVGLNRVSETAKDTTDAIVEGLPTVVGMANDVLSAARAATMGTHAGISLVSGMAGDLLDIGEFTMEKNKDRIQAGMELKIAKSDANYELTQQLLALQNMVTDVDQQLLETYSLKEKVQQAAGNYQAALQEGLRLIDERTEKRALSSAEVQEYRFQDLGFRVFRNDAIQKYRAQFDLAAKYVYMAATAYDYETNLLGTASGSGRKFLSDIARQRTLGVVNLSSEGVVTPSAGFPGLADVMARLKQNFDVYKTQLGFNNPQTETTPFSLRTELFRIKKDSTSNDTWRDVLKDHKVDDLWKIPEYRRYCRPFAPESAGAQPGIVIKFPTTVTYGKNFFGWPLSGADSAYSTSNFSTRVRSVGLWFENYNNAGLSSTPRVYLVPIGADVLRSPTGDGFATREWQVQDQKIPVPFPIGDSDLANPSFIAANDSLSDELSAIRKVSDFRAYPYSGAFNPSQTATDSRLIGRSVWNTQWMMIIPGSTLLFNKDVGLNTFINSVDDIKMFFQTYAYSGN